MASNADILAPLSCPFRKRQRFKTRKTDVPFSEILIHTIVLIEKGLLFPEKMFVCGLNLPHLEIDRI